MSEATRSSAPSAPSAPVAVPEPPLAARWHGLSPGARIAVAVVALLVGVNVLLTGLEKALGGSQQGPTSSSYATVPGGLAAFADLLEARAHPVGRLRTTLDRGDLDPRITLVIADAPDMNDDEADAIARFVNDGGRLVVTGNRAPDVLRRLAVGDLSWSSRRVDSARPITPVPEVTGVAEVEVDGTGSWSEPGATLPVLADDGRVLATVFVSGRGRVVALANTSPLQNRLLDDADNAAFALAAVGEPGRPVGFAEAHHGFGMREGLGALPEKWKWALGIGAFAAAVAMWARGRRLGPPEEVERELPPPRRVYVDAIAASLARTRRPADAIRPLQEAARQRLVRRGALPPDADDTAVRRAAAHLGVPEDEIDALLTPVSSDDRALVVGRLLARLEGGTL